jgi:hypothetical protein
VVATTDTSAGVARLAAYRSHGKPCFGFLDDAAAPRSAVCTATLDADSETGIDAYAASSTAYAESPEAARTAPRPQEFVWGVAPAGTRTVELSRRGAHTAIAQAYEPGGTFGDLAYWVAPFRAVGLQTHIRAMDDSGRVLAERDYGAA